MRASTLQPGQRHVFLNLGRRQVGYRVHVAAQLVEPLASPSYQRALLPRTADSLWMPI